MCEEDSTYNVIDEEETNSAWIPLPHSFDIVEPFLHENYSLIMLNNSLENNDINLVDMPNLLENWEESNMNSLLLNNHQNYKINDEHCINLQQESNLEAPQLSTTSSLKHKIVHQKCANMENTTDVIMEKESPNVWNDFDFLSTKYYQNIRHNNDQSWQIENIEHSKNDFSQFNMIINSNMNNNNSIKTNKNISSLFIQPKLAGIGNTTIGYSSNKSMLSNYMIDNQSNHNMNNVPISIDNSLYVLNKDKEKIKSNQTNHEKNEMDNNPPPFKKIRIDNENDMDKNYINNNYQLMPIAKKKTSSFHTKSNVSTTTIVTIGNNMKQKLKQCRKNKSKLKINNNKIRTRCVAINSPKFDDINVAISNCCDPDHKNACIFCKKNFNSKNHFERHCVGLHLNRKLFHCPVCKQETNQECNLETHILTHCPNKKITAPFVCIVCLQYNKPPISMKYNANPRFSRKSSLLRHFEICHPKLILNSVKTKNLDWIKNQKPPKLNFNKYYNEIQKLTRWKKSSNNTRLDPAIAAIENSIKYCSPDVEMPLYLHEMIQNLLKQVPIELEN